MIVDTSAVVAILRLEPEAEKFTELLQSSTYSVMCSPHFLELCMVVLRNKEQSGVIKIKDAIEELGIHLIAFTPEMAELAAKAFEKYGKGSGHPAQLNFGDCMAYAASKVESLPLLFKGDDFSKTDVERVT
jgi:ribonuclease VapC